MVLVPGKDYKHFPNPSFPVLSFLSGLLLSSFIFFSSHLMSLGGANCSAGPRSRRRSYRSEERLTRTLGTAAIEAAGSSEFLGRCLGCLMESPRRLLAGGLLSLLMLQYVAMLP